MSAHSSLAGSTVADSWPMTCVMAGLSAMPVGHASQVMIDHLFCVMAV
ncbi:hypothetical protein MOK15_05525 [Sphingobium sp. BYY-5]|nr:hypothetical protein [Sphingobium sp. BYY-5]MCI4589551.1 hypothetical protein [Sphingobium sp. BYY-5]